MEYTSILDKCQLVAIYLGNTCNFNCSYCDRDYIENSIGSQGVSSSNIDDIENFFYQLYKESNLKIKTLAFHGGEPFLYVKRMDQILERIQPYLDQNNLDVLITTNGSLVIENEDFVRKWAKYLRFTFSYDFLLQEENREFVDVAAVGNLCKELRISIMWQYVMPITDKRAYSLASAEDIINKAQYSENRVVNLIPLRHHRGEDKFKDFFNDVNLYEFSEDFIRFINVLYNYNVRPRIDGAYKEVDKNYTGKHYKIILSPDGYIYPEYDFCEYQSAEFRVGQWYNKQAIKIGSNRNFGYVPNFYETDPNKDDTLIRSECQSCSVKSDCGIKYLYKMFDKKPSGRCALFYNIVNSAITYTAKLNSKDNFYTWIMPPKQNNIDKFVPASTDFKSHFLKVDNLFSAKNEIIFSMFRRYNCFAGCHICYVDKFFEKDKSKFSRFIPTEVSKEMGDRWLSTFKGYYFATANDDLYYLKLNHPNLFNWYKDHASVFHFGSITDNAFVRAFDILMNDIDTPKGIYEITFSDQWLAKVNFKKVLEQLEQLQHKLPIVQIKYIVTTDGSLDWPTYVELKAFMDANGISASVHIDILTKETTVLDRSDQEMSWAAYDGEIYTICGEGDYLQYDSFFLTQVDAIDPNVQPYDVLDEEFTFTRHLSRHLKGKQEVYNRNLHKLKFSSNQYNMKYTDYYKFITKNMIVSDDYSFIPDVSVTPHDTLYWQLVNNEGWQKTPLGLLNLERNSQVVPLLQFKK